MDPLLQGQVALVTGGASGIGRAVATLYVAHGATVVTLDNGASGSRADIVGDVRDPDAHRRAVDHTMDRYGRLDVLVANAGVHDGGARLDEVTPAELVDLCRNVVDVNLLGVLLAVQAARPALVSSRGSVIITMSDAAFTFAGTGAGSVYAASKTALLGVMRALGNELAPDVRVNGVAPGGVPTNLQAVNADVGVFDAFDSADDVRRAVESMNPLGVMLSPEQVAASYVYLASTWSAGMTGQVLRPDGGLALR